MFRFLVTFDLDRENSCFRISCFRILDYSKSPITNCWPDFAVVLRRSVA